jgi:hypothetical protein
MSASGWGGRAGRYRQKDLYTCSPYAHFHTDSNTHQHTHEHPHLNRYIDRNKHSGYRHTHSHADGDFHDNSNSDPRCAKRAAWRRHWSIHLIIAHGVVTASHPEDSRRKTRVLTKIFPVPFH